MGSQFWKKKLIPPQMYSRLFFSTKKFTTKYRKWYKVPYMHHCIYRYLQIWSKNNSGYQVIFSNSFTTVYDSHSIQKPVNPALSASDVFGVLYHCKDIRWEFPTMSFCCPRPQYPTIYDVSPPYLNFYYFWSFKLNKLN